MLLMRLLVGCTLILRGVAAVSGEAHAAPFLLEVAGAAAGVFILGGMWTPVMGVLAGAVEAWIALTLPATQPLSAILAVLGIVLAMIGPGAWSIDARLYGRKQILPTEL